MAMRRQRIKPLANIQLSSKRKIKLQNDAKIAKVDENDEHETEKQVILGAEYGSSLEVRGENLIDTTSNEYNFNNDADENENNSKWRGFTQELDGKKEIIIGENNINSKESTIEKNDLINNEELPSKNIYDETADRLDDSDAFKCPPKVEYQKPIIHTLSSGIDDVFYSDIEENALQMDLEKSPFYISPSKNLIRQRIRPTPHFNQRRNSFVSSPPHASVNEENNPTTSNVINDVAQTTQTRRERHHSASFIGNIHTSHHHHTPHKYLPTGVTNATLGRIRTESGCSVFSDSNNSSYKSRKTEDKQNTRKEFEARFVNGVPEKSAIKMSDLIYYNPATNPMEQKQNPSVKFELSENASNDFKPFTEKQTKEADTDADTEATPVPQLKLNAKGELILDDKSLVIETTAEQEARKVLANSSLIYLDENTGMNGFYSRKKRTREWMASETIKFYRCLQNIGTDFSLMVSLFPNRTRRDLKLKFKKEERKNAHLINKALLYPKQFDIESLKVQINEEEKQREGQAKAKCKESKKRKVSNISKAKRILINEDVYQNENEQQIKTHKTKPNKDKSDDIVQNKKKCPVKIEQKIKSVCEINVNQEKSVDFVQNEKVTVTSNPNHSVEVDQGGKVSCSKMEKTFKGKIKKFKQLNKDQIIVQDNSNSNGNLVIHGNKNANVQKRRRRRKRTPKKPHGEEKRFKEEIIKVENKQVCNQTSNEIEYQDTKQLQTEIDELLDSDIEIQQDTTYENSTVKVFSSTCQVGQYEKHVNTSPCPDKSAENYKHADWGNSKYIFNLDDCTSIVKDDVNYINMPPTTDLPLAPTRSQLPQCASQSLYSIENETDSLERTIPETDIINNSDTCSTVISENGLNEEDIQSILTELAEGSLVLVSTLDPDDPDKVLNEIYMVDNKTGDLCDEPLKIPDNIVQCILTVVS